MKGTKGSGKSSGEVKSSVHMVLTIAKVSKYFLNLEKRSKSQMHIRKLIDSGGAEVTEPKFVFKYIKGFYSDLHKRRAFKTEEECFKYLESINMPQLNEFDRNRCEGI